MEIDMQTILQQDIDLGIRSTSTDVDFNYYTDESLTKQAEFYKETQKNADILATTGLFEHDCVPEGYKLVLEEDTGEYFLILMTNESNKTEYSKIQIKDSGFVNDLLPNSTNKTNDPSFLSQVSINQELDKLNENLNFNSTTLDDTLSNLDSENLLDESWINQLLVDSEHQTGQVYDQIKINDDKMLSKLNENQTFVLSPPLVQNNYLNNDTIYDDTIQFESLLDQAIMAHEKEMNKNETFLSCKQQIEELDLSNFLSYVDDTSKLNTTMKNVNLTYRSNSFKISSDDDKAKNLADERNIFNNSVYDIELKVSRENFLLFFFFSLHNFMTKHFFIF